MKNTGRASLMVGGSHSNCGPVTVNPIFSKLLHISDSPEMKIMACQEGEERPPGFDVEEWDNGSIYEGEFMNGLKHGKGKYTWKTGEARAKSFPSLKLFFPHV